VRRRHLGVRREQLITEAGSQVHQMRDLLECGAGGIGHREFAFSSLQAMSCSWLPMVVH